MERFKNRPNNTRLIIADMPQSTTEKELYLYCKTREGGAKLSRAAQKLREKADFVLQMDRDAANKGTAKLSKAKAKAQARLDFKAEMYTRNVQKVGDVTIRREFQGWPRWVALDAVLLLNNPTPLIFLLGCPRV